MTTKNTEIRMMWLMLLIMVGVGAWLIEIKTLTYICGLGFVLSVMQYVSEIQTGVLQLQQQPTLRQTSRLPLYIASILACLGLIFNQSLLVAFGLSAWIYYFLKWLRRLEAYLIDLQQRPTLKAEPTPLVRAEETIAAQALPEARQPEHSNANDLLSQLQTWLIHGNPVLKAAIVTLFIGVVLLLRFAAEHWQMSLGLKLSMVAAVSVGVVGLGRRLLAHNRSFAIALQGLGLAGIFLSLLFAQHYAVITSFVWVMVIFSCCMLLTAFLSVQQQSVELAVMAIAVAYIAPFTLPNAIEDAVALLTYYFLVNIVVAIISTLRPWKYLNQLSLALTIMVGGGYAFIHGTTAQQLNLALLVFAHSALFIYLGLRYSQLQESKENAHSPLEAVIDLTLIVFVPIVAFASLYVLYLDEHLWQAVWSGVYAVLYAGLYAWLKQRDQLSFLRPYYLALAIIFTAMLPAIVLPAPWSMLVWALESTLLMFIALKYQQILAEKLSYLFAAMAVFSVLYQTAFSQILPTYSMLAVAAAFTCSVVMAHWSAQTRAQLSLGGIATQSIQLLVASSFFYIGLLELIDHQHQVLICVSILTAAWLMLHHLMCHRQIPVYWVWMRSLGMIPIYLTLFLMLSDFSSQGAVDFPTLTNRLGIFVMGLILVWVACKPVTFLEETIELSVSLGMIGLMFASICIWPQALWSSITFLPLLSLLYLAWKHPERYRQLGQTYCILMLFGAWIVLSQMLSEQVFVAYWLPIFNPFDLVSIAMLIATWNILRLQWSVGRDPSWVAIAMVLSLLWLSSYIVLRALHVYLDTPYNTFDVWSDSTVQFSFTLLWVSLAGLTMGVASRRKLRPLWLLGASILVLVSLKLVMVDLAQVGAILRVLSFFVAGGMMLLIAYLAPIPEDVRVQKNDVVE